MRTMLKIVELWFPPETEKTTGHLISRKWRATQDPVVTKQFAICLPCQTPTGSTTCTARVRHGSKTEALASAHSPNLGSEPTQTYFLCLWWELASEMSSNEHEYPSQLGLSRADHKTKGTPLFPCVPWFLLEEEGLVKRLPLVQRSSLLFFRFRWNRSSS